jgi:hypothetical protein
MSTTEPIDTPHNENEHQGFDAFWAEQLRREAAERGQAPTEVIRGVTVTVPQDLPLNFRAKARAMRNDDGDDSFKELLASLFGVDVLDAWVQAGMGAREFRTVLAWAMAHGDGNPITWQQAYELVMAKDEDGDEGKAPSSTRANGGSGGSGRSSKPTSGASTSSGRRTSRR